jgi:hypothetical protein
MPLKAALGGAMHNNKSAHDLIDASGAENPAFAINQPNCQPQQPAAALAAQCGMDERKPMMQVGDDESLKRPLIGALPAVRPEKKRKQWTRQRKSVAVNQRSEDDVIRQAKIMVQQPPCKEKTHGVGLPPHDADAAILHLRIPLRDVALACFEKFHGN